MMQAEVTRNIKVHLIERERAMWQAGATTDARLLADVLDHIVYLEGIVNLRDAEIERLTQARRAGGQEVSTESCMRLVRSLIRGAAHREDAVLRAEIVKPLLAICDGYLEGV